MRQSSKTNKKDNMEAILIPGIVFSTMFGIAFLFFTTRNKERLALIDKGASADLFSQEGKHQYTGLKVGITFIGISIGILVGYLLGNAGIMDRDVAFPAMIFLFTGITLVITNTMLRKMKTE
ncbi:MAG: hypothetical protein HN542_09785 [Flavobacteriales bacterium]|jgi:hypothetical protein|nr:hypothetical protein [Flavobacteriales bacterium]NCG30251.1 hypothetical protein [Bacteroidota bacterium]MBT3964586.1 hypothetical protein [Flavobacteriales bacterium]MBT4704600.1 hypothetical protein [Flavobacteriales bacterium]MBT4930773.1 hypothetical protein [Flavobacteriales bacterium]